MLCWVTAAKQKIFVLPPLPTESHGAQEVRPVFGPSPRVRRVLKLAKYSSRSQAYKYHTPLLFSFPFVFHPSGSQKFVAIRCFSFTVFVTSSPSPRPQNRDRLGSMFAFCFETAGGEDSYRTVQRPCCCLSPPQ